MSRRMNTNERCPYSPINGTPCLNPGTVPLRRRYDRSPVLPSDALAVCEEHLPRYLAHGWKREKIA